MLVVGLIDIQHMQAVIKVFFFFFKKCYNLFFFFFFFQNCYYSSDLEIQWPRSHSIEESLSSVSELLQDGR